VVNVVCMAASRLTKSALVHAAGISDSPAMVLIPPAPSSVCCWSVTAGPSLITPCRSSGTRRSRQTLGGPHPVTTPHMNPPHV
jgi:hypothetical protein